MEYLAISVLLITNGLTLLTLGGVYWRKRVWKRRAKIANWSENVLLHNINKAADVGERVQAWLKRQKPGEVIKSKDWPDELGE